MRGFTTTLQFSEGSHVSGRIGSEFAVGQGNVLTASGIELRFSTIDGASLSPTVEVREPFR